LFSHIVLALRMPIVALRIALEYRALVYIPLANYDRLPAPDAPMWLSGFALVAADEGIATHFD
jgi:hypothetical protein